MNTKRWLALIAAVVLILVSIGFRFTMNIATGFLDNMMDLDETLIEEKVIEEGSFNERIAILNLEGVIQDTSQAMFLTEGYQHESFLNSIEKAGEDNTIKAILLKVNSPGGAVGETAQIHRELIDIQEKYDKPIYVSMGATAASGGYYVSAPADKIFAEPSTLTGSIGVIMQSINFSGLAEKYGVTFNTIKSGKHKDIMSQTREMTEEEHEILQTIIDEMYGDFVDVIVEGREMDEAKVRELGDGRIYTGSQAAANGLVDEVGNYEDALTALKKDNNLEKASVIQYGAGLGFLGNFGMNLKGMFQNKDAEVNMLTELIRKSDQPRAMYLY